MADRCRLRLMVEAPEGFLDTFQGTPGTALSAHTSDSGGTWIPYLPSDGPEALIGTNTVHLTNADWVGYLTSLAGTGLGQFAKVTVAEANISSRLWLGLNNPQSSSWWAEGLMARFHFDGSVYVSQDGVTLAQIGSGSPDIVAGDVLECRLTAGGTLQALINNVVVVGGAITGGGGSGPQYLQLDPFGTTTLAISSFQSGVL